MTETEKKYEKANDFTPEEKMLLTLRDELYKGNWESFRNDLKERLKQRPYVWKRVNIIEQDLERIEKLENYELKNKINLADLIKKEKSPKN